ncbi:indolepyruvate oxidoreductase subunit beta family protein [Parahaliea mediterranea]|uniref:Indolepyruvate oxidoreductase subunit beta family protein n=1 Tax=Parahaliea mediterranea TaxID=651086 RepID=A0A939DG13_9GAMM|nr:indolepyruvate oxidoreductase subunit beta family protein [Parahaliea mediterranea]MBN7797379.1 indolepyruvate oxidoreductase subunit beta family protein [Parahaliea mediterranea]
MTKQRTINMVVAALGGEGGGVFTNWVIDVANSEGWLCQSTFLAGVAQRTGATIYYLEMYPRGDIPEGERPVMSLFPAQGDIDVAIASEVAEAGRMVQRGFVTPDRTTLIASDHRVYGITEKINLGDGTIDPAAVQAIAGRYARDYIHFDMAALAKAHNAVISAVMLGALAGSGVLPFRRESFIAAIEASGKAVKTNLAAFNASYQAAQARGVQQFEPAKAAEPAAGFALPQAHSPEGEQLLARLRVFPENCHEVLYRGLLKLVDYQDYAYAGQYLDELEDIHERDDGAGDHQLTRETARYLALWMCFEDIPRVAQLKTRASRMDKVRDEVKAEPGQLFDVTEFFRPRVEEVCGMLPAGLGRAVQSSRPASAVIGRFTGGKKLRTNTIGVFLVLRILAGLRRWRRRSLAYAEEHALIGRWLQAIRRAAQGDDLDLARELAECGRLVKGYGDTRARTSAQVADILARAEQGGASAAAVAHWRETAFADDDGVAFRQSLAASSAGSEPKASNRAA